MPKATDISKQMWKFQEGLVYLALTELVSSPEKVHWNYNKASGSSKKEYTPNGMSIDPDIVIGDEHDSPETMIFVTHATMEHGSEKKFWRTVPEAIEEKALRSHPKVLSVLYAGNVKANIMAAYEYLFDGVYHLDQSAEGTAISSIVVDLTKQYGSKSPHECLELLKEIRNRNVSPWKEFYAAIYNLYLSSYGPKHDALISVSTQKTSRYPSARKTTLRQSICKLLTLPSSLQEDLITRHYNVKKVPVHAVILKWFSPIVIGGSFRLSDQELKEFLENTPRDIIDYELQAAKACDTMMDSVNTLLLIDARKELNDWIVEHYDELIQPSLMFRYLNEIFFDNYTLISERISQDSCPTSHWLFESIMSMLRTETGRADGYGYSALAEDVGETAGITGGYIYVADFSNRKNTINYELNKKIATVFSRHLTRLGKDQVEKTLSQSISTLCRSLFNYNISTYRKHNPIDWLVCSALDSSGIKYIYPTGHQSFLSDELSGITTSTNNIICIADGKCWIKCQSAYKGSTDKRKELCGRIGAMKLKYPADELYNKKFYLVIDGYFDDEDIRLLDKAGWDGIYYYDEIQELIEAVKSIV